MENTVETMLTQVQDDAALSAQETPTLADVLNEDTAAQQPTDSAASEAPASEPGWMRRRIDAAVRKANSELEARLRAEYDAQLAPLREMQLASEADRLVAEGKISDREMALNYVRATKGLPASPTPDPAPAPAARDEKGRFVSREPDTAAAERRAAVLVRQAENIKQKTGIDVMHLYETDSTVKQKIINGEWDFTDVLGYAPEQNVAPKVPSPVRSSNGMGIGDVDFRSMSSENLAKVNALLERGGKIDARK